MPTVITFYTINNVSKSVHRYNFTLDFFKTAWQKNLGSERK